MVDFLGVPEPNDNHNELGDDTKTSYCDHHTCIRCNVQYDLAVQKYVTLIFLVTEVVRLLVN